VNKQASGRIMENIFIVKNLVCAYKPDKPVLKISDLHIPNGKLIFLIGKSGIGKSTFIETLGLMNNTIVDTSETSIRFFPENTEQGIELKSSWHSSNENLAKLRLDYFSFIFQNTNLMPNFSAGQNMMASCLIQGVDVKKAKKDVLQMMQKLGLEHGIFDKRVVDLSGGQQQRLSFVRAAITDFTVLFGDEPTGNLDEKTAFDLMSILRELIRIKGKTCIIVSHDLKLADKFADVVIPIAKKSTDDGTVYGEIFQHDVISRTADTWHDAQGKPIQDTYSYFSTFLS